MADHISSRKSWESCSSYLGYFSNLTYVRACTRVLPREPLGLPRSSPGHTGSAKCKSKQSYLQNLNAVVYCERLRPLILVSSHVGRYGGKSSSPRRLQKVKESNLVQRHLNPVKRMEFCSPISLALGHEQQVLQQIRRCVSTTCRANMYKRLRHACWRSS